ncbi:nose resistant to fluoxetine protein 6-like isoform X2 [Periplaneta americana]|uniref:nose resistant to fluoxetine protein 6-like isoform X2 n=1 Tax=Periplaneta americana TaxID=6978 RepID=UPI0037E8A90D
MSATGQCALVSIAVLDASTKIPDNVLMGQTIHLGNFDECVSVKDVDTKEGIFSGKHCLAWFQNGQFNITKKTEKLQGLPDILISDNPSLRLSYCIPSTCGAEDLQQALNFVLQALRLSLVASVGDTDCHMGEGKTLAVEAWVAIGVFIFIILLVVSSTAYDLLEKGTKKEVLAAFSIFANGKKLLSTKQSADALQCMHGMRFITMCWVIWAHRYLLTSQMPLTNGVDLRQYMTDWSRLYITNSSLQGDTFLTLAGLLISYVFLNRMRYRISGFNILLHYLHRFIRLTPAYAMVVLFEATLKSYLSSSPLFQQAADVSTSRCQTNWWTNLLFINNYVNADSSCMIQSWYISLDMQLFLLSPLLLYPLWKWPPRRNIPILVVLTLAGFAAPFAISYVEEYSANLLVGNWQKREEFNQYLYGVPQARFGPWVIGMAFGYFIHEAKRKQFKLSKIQIAVSWILFNVALMGALNGAATFYEDFTQKTVLESAFYNGLFRNVWGFGIGIFVLLCATGEGGPPNILLSWKIFPTASRLTYCMFLIFPTYQVTQVFSTQAPLYFSDITVWPIFFGDVICCLVVSALLHLCVEAPAINLEKCLLGKMGARRTPAVTSPTLRADLTRDLSEMSIEDLRNNSIAFRILYD